MEGWLVERMAKTCFSDPSFDGHDRLARTLFMKGHEYDLAKYINALDSTECVQRLEGDAGGEATPSSILDWTHFDCTATSRPVDLN